MTGLQAQGRILEAGPGGKYTYSSAGEAVRNALPGDTVMLHEGIYREEIVFSRGGSKDAPIVLMGAPGEQAVITGSEPLDRESWKESAHAGVYTARIPGDFFGNNTEGQYFNPFAVSWKSKGFSQKEYYSCGCVYYGDRVYAQRWSEEEVKETPETWFARVDKESGETLLWVNFGEADPRTGEETEVNCRMQCITAAWNQGYITVRGLKVIRGCGPKTIDFWMTSAEAMFGAIAVNGGHHWIVEDCEVTQCRGVAIDFGNGSAKQELRYGGEPALYGHHILRNNYVHENGTNGMMAYRGAYTEICGNRLVNNNALNTGLLSEAYVKDVSGGWGIYIHNNYFYSDQTWSAYPIWMDSECDMCRISCNIIYCKGEGQGFTALDYECNSGWNLLDNNIFVGIGQKLFASTATYMVNNLWLDMPERFSIWPPTNLTGLMGTEGFDGFTRCMRIVKPGTLETIGSNKTSRWQTFCNNSKMLGNIFAARGLTTTYGKQTTSFKVSSEGPVKEQASPVNGVYGEMVLNTRVNEQGEPIANPDFSGGSWYAFAPIAPEELKKAAKKYVGIFAWVPATAQDEALLKQQLGGVDAHETYGNECDYNAAVAGAKLLDDPAFAAARGYTAETHSVEDAAGSCRVEADRDSFVLYLEVGDKVLSASMPPVKGKDLGASECYKQAYSRYFPEEDRAVLLPPDVKTDFFGNVRKEETSIGPFAELRSGAYRCWPGND